MKEIRECCTNCWFYYNERCDYEEFYNEECNYELKWDAEKNAFVPRYWYDNMPIIYTEEEEEE